MADPPLGPFAVFQYALPPSLNSVPPTAVTSGMLAGKFTAKPWEAMLTPSSQSAAPLSPDEASQVMPSVAAFWASDR